MFNIVHVKSNGSFRNMKQVFPASMLSNPDASRVK